MKKILSALVAMTLAASLVFPLMAAPSTQATKAPAKETAARTKDPVCGMEIDPAKSKEKSVHNGKTYYFCSSHCKAEFEKNPAKYAK